MATKILTRANKRLFFWFLLGTIFLLPLWMALAWYLTPKRKLEFAIIDKTVLTTNGQEHISFNWILRHQKFAKRNNELYETGKDYFGFFPKKYEKFQIKGLERFNTSQLEQLSTDVDATYLTDTYGIFKNEWYKQGDAKERSGTVYGGTSIQDIAFLKQMKAKHKLIITEFNCLGSPTQPSVRYDFEKMFGLKWTGWTGRFFYSFDTTVNKELPKWLINNYKVRHNGEWPFTKSGIALVHTDDRIVILENETHLRKEIPYIYSSQEGQEHYSMPEKIKYPFWFDIINPDTSYNHVISSFVIEANDAGREELQKYNIPFSFPAITTHINKDYRFFYFSADICDNPVKMGSSYFKGIGYLRSFMYNTDDIQERESFFWELFRPLLTTILNDYYYSPDRPQPH